ncbi:hypothetical protein AB0M28_13540 [Streptomyces sp. NPDC051940]|uniref:hypothetical protein n=1 Tax=Streptomyces sp. NPDC051940 TaxID=3155675 RepID=UPI0034465C6D
MALTTGFPIRREDVPPEMEDRLGPPLPYSPGRGGHYPQQQTQKPAKEPDKK